MKKAPCKGAFLFLLLENAGQHVTIEYQQRRDPPPLHQYQRILNPRPYAHLRR